MKGNANAVGGYRNDDHRYPKLVFSFSDLSLRLEEFFIPAEFHSGD
jgi:hypothetical protein